jgi:hypothetical protein
VLGRARRGCERGRDDEQGASDDAGGLQSTMTVERGGQHDEVPHDASRGVMLKRYGGRERM